MYKLFKKQEMSYAELLFQSYNIESIITKYLRDEHGMYSDILGVIKDFADVPEHIDINENNQNEYIKNDELNFEIESISIKTSVEKLRVSGVKRLVCNSFIQELYSSSKTVKCYHLHIRKIELPQAESLYLYACGGTFETLYFPKLESFHTQGYRGISVNNLILPEIKQLKVGHIFRAINNLVCLKAQFIEVPLNVFTRIEAPLAERIVVICSATTIAGKKIICGKDTIVKTKSSYFEDPDPVLEQVIQTIVERI